MGIVKIHTYLYIEREREYQGTTFPFSPLRASKVILSYICMRIIEQGLEGGFMMNYSTFYNIRPTKG